MQSRVWSEQIYKDDIKWKIDLPATGNQIMIIIDVVSYVVEAQIFPNILQLHTHLEIIYMPDYNNRKAIQCKAMYSI